MKNPLMDMPLKISTKRSSQVKAQEGIVTTFVRKLSVYLVKLFYTLLHSLCCCFRAHSNQFMERVFLQFLTPFRSGEVKTHFAGCFGISKSFWWVTQVYCRQSLQFIHENRVTWKFHGGSSVTDYHQAESLDFHHPKSNPWIKLYKPI